jgi:hypothetical protein
MCDVQVWKLLRRDSGLSREQTEAALREMIAGLFTAKRSPEQEAYAHHSEDVTAVLASPRDR